MQGEIEKLDEETIPAAESPPKKRRRVKKTGHDAAKDGTAEANGEPAKKKTKRPREAQDADQGHDKEKKSKKPKMDQPAHDTAPAAALTGKQAAHPAAVSSATAGSAQPEMPGMCP